MKNLILIEFEEKYKFGDYIEFLNVNILKITNDISDLYSIIDKDYNSIPNWWITIKKSIEKEGFHYIEKEFTQTLKMYREGRLNRYKHKIIIDLSYSGEEYYNMRFTRYYKVTKKALHILRSKKLSKIICVK